VQNGRLFTKLKVLELASVLAGPSVGQFFAELGAEVIKVENPNTGGDVTRSWRIAGEETDDRSAYFCSCNWGKKSVALDLTRPSDRSQVIRLAQRCDIVIASYKPGDAEKLGVGYHQLKAVNPSIIYGQITGYGPGDDRVGYDAVIQAESGFMDLNGEKDGEPTKMPVALIDVLAAHQLKEGLLLAILHKERTGEGSKVDVSLLDAAIASLANQATNWLVAGKVPSRQGSVHPNIAPYGETFLTKDGRRLLLAVGSDKQFEALLTVLEISLTEEIRKELITNPLRVKNRVRLRDLLSQSIRQMESQPLLARLSERKVPAGLLQNVRDALVSPQVQHLFIQGSHFRGLRNFVANPTEEVKLSEPPHLGQHTNLILQEIQR